MNHCINCGSEINQNSEVCPDCGVNQTKPLTGGHGDRSSDQKYCQNCGDLINKQAELCPECGVDQPELRESTDSSDQVAAGVLALILGGIGAHKFYQGATKIGLLYLCLFWTFIPAIIAFIEGILILIADDDTYAEKYADGSILGI
jgi:TM2 domain-containing membrane protein YozV/RNA polymerase subunit RPABC4/transcription elongation factor Spt4